MVFCFKDVEWLDKQCNLGQFKLWQGESGTYEHFKLLWFPLRELMEDPLPAALGPGEVKQTRTF